MNDLNHITLSGTLVDQPRERSTQSGKRCVSFRLKTERTYKGQTYSSYISVEHWGDAVDTVLRTAAGTPLIVSGRLETQSWTDKNGNKRSDTIVSAETVAGYIPPMQAQAPQYAPPQQQQYMPQQQQQPQAQNAYGGNADPFGNNASASQEMPF